MVEVITLAVGFFVETLILCSNFCTSAPSLHALSDLTRVPTNPYPDRRTDRASSSIHRSAQWWLSAYPPMWCLVPLSAHDDSFKGRSNLGIFRKADVLPHFLRGRRPKKLVFDSVNGSATIRTSFAGVVYYYTACFIYTPLYSLRCENNDFGEAHHVWDHAAAW